MCIRDREKMVPRSPLNVSESLPVSPISTSSEAANAFAASRSASAGIEASAEPDVEPVSYTHLDVYKRQASMAVMKAALTRWSSSCRNAAAVVPPGEVTCSRRTVGCDPDSISSFAEPYICLLYTSRCV